MIDAGWGRIVNITSAASLHPPGPLNSAYATAKVALNQLTRHLACEVAGTGVTANVIHPGDVKTDMWQDIHDRVAVMGPEAEPYRQWAAWVEETGGDPPEKAVDLVLRADLAMRARTATGEFCWVEDPLQAPIPSWGEPVRDDDSHGSEGDAPAAALGRTRASRSPSWGSVAPRSASCSCASRSDDAQATIAAAWDAGIRYFDTAPWYGRGLSELRTGAGLRDHPRDEFALSTKVGRWLRPVGGRGLRRRRRGSAGQPERGRLRLHL